MNKMCFMTVANAPYQKYAPFWIYFLNKAYPSSHKIVLLDRNMLPNTKKAIALLSCQCDVRENAFKDLNNVDANTIKCLRWLYSDSMFDNFDCMSIGDIDMAIFKETPTYAEQHLAHCELTGLPYSNFIRPTNPRRVCGIHVVKPKEWFEGISKSICKYYELLRNHKIQFPNPLGLNEQLLLKIITESFGTTPKNLNETYWSSLVTSNHHGCHIRLAQHQGVNGLKGARGYGYHKKELLQLMRDPTLKSISNIFPDIGNIFNKVATFYEQH